jgi:hypothetical protein
VENKKDRAMLLIKLCYYQDIISVGIILESPKGFHPTTPREIDWYSHKLDPVLTDASDQEKLFGGSLVADTMSHFQAFLTTDRQNRPRGIIEINPQELLDKTP